MSKVKLLPVDRFLQTLEIVYREGSHLSYSWGRVYSQPIDTSWVKDLDTRPEVAEQLEAFVSRFGRMQDTIADKLLPRWLIALAETPGSQIETLNRAEKLGVVESVERWLEARALRNRLVHEYIGRADDFAADLLLAKEYSLVLVDSFNCLRAFAAERMGIGDALLPGKLAIVES